MAQTPAERRARRNAYAQSLIDPRTGQPFKNYNALDTYQRNIKAQSRGFANRAEERREQEEERAGRQAGPLVSRVEEDFPLSWERFLGDQNPTERLARDFLKAFGPYPDKANEKYRSEAETLRAAYLAGMDDRGFDWDWRLWRHEYKEL